MGKNNVNVKESGNNHVKVTWEDIYKDFQQRHPNLQKMVYRWEMLGFATIKLYLMDGTQMKYDYDLKRAEFISREKE